MRMNNNKKNVSYIYILDVEKVLDSSTKYVGIILSSSGSKVWKSYNEVKEKK